jgi:hypothetical protein
MIFLGAAKPGRASAPTRVRWTSSETNEIRERLPLKRFRVSSPVLSRSVA